MARISSPSTGLDNETLIPYIEHRLGTQSRFTLKFPSADVTAYEFKAYIEEIDTPPGTPPEAGYVVVTSGEKWILANGAFAKSSTDNAAEGVPSSEAVFVIPVGLGMASPAAEANYTMTGAPDTQPRPGLIKYYQMGIRFDSLTGTSEELVLQLRLLYSVVSQNATGE